MQLYSAYHARLLLVISIIAFILHSRKHEPLKRLEIDLLETQYVCIVAKQLMHNKTLPVVDVQSVWVTVWVENLMGIRR